MTLRKRTLSIMALNITKLCKMTLRITALSIMDRIYVTHHNDSVHKDNQYDDTQYQDTQHNDTQHNDRIVIVERHYSTPLTE
jgi:hypothetical protein